MTPKQDEEEAIKHIASLPETRQLLSFLKRLVAYHSDVRQIKDITTESIKGRQLACDIIDTEIINRLVRSQNTNKVEIKEEYE